MLQTTDKPIYWTFFGVGEIVKEKEKRYSAI
jgi:hypothetical protein